MDNLTGFSQTIEAIFQERDGDPAVHHPSDPEYNKVCFLQRTEASDGLI